MSADASGASPQMPCSTGVLRRPLPQPLPYGQVRSGKTGSDLAVLARRIGDLNPAPDLRLWPQPVRTRTNTRVAGLNVPGLYAVAVATATVGGGIRSGGDDAAHAGRQRAELYARRGARFRAVAGRGRVSRQRLGGLLGLRAGQDRLHPVTFDPMQFASGNTRPGRDRFFRYGKSHTQSGVEFGALRSERETRAKRVRSSAHPDSMIASLNTQGGGQHSGCRLCCLRSGEFD